MQGPYEQDAEPYVPDPSVKNYVLQPATSRAFHGENASNEDVAASVNNESGLPPSEINFDEPEEDFGATTTNMMQLRFGANMDPE